MRGRLIQALRFLAVGVGIVVLTSFSIDAADTISGSQTALSIFAKKITEATCPTGMVGYQIGERKLCIDIYEASVSKECQVVSVADTKPWTFVAAPQAKALCAKAGKRLPTPEEWYQAALGTPDGIGVCNIDGKLEVAGLFKDCKSGVGAFDMVGNAWEWVDGEITDSTYLGRSLPTEGYVSEVDESGVALKTQKTPEVVFNEDYFWTTSFGRFMMMRGGFYGSRSDGGVYAVHTKTEPTFASGAVGFRCVKDL